MLRAVHTARRRLACHSSASAVAAAAAAAAEPAVSGGLLPPLSPPLLPHPRSCTTKSHAQHNAPPCRPHDEFPVPPASAIDTARNTSSSSSSSSSSIVGGDGNVSSSSGVDLQSASHCSGNPKSTVGMRGLLGDVSSSSSSSSSSRSRSRSRSNSDLGGSSDAPSSCPAQAARAAGPHLAASAASCVHAHSHAQAVSHPSLQPDALALAMRGGAFLGGSFPVGAFAVGLVPAAALTLMPSAAATSAAAASHLPRSHHDANLPSCLVRGYSAQATAPTSAAAAAAAGAEATVAAPSAAGAADEAPSPPDSISDGGSDSGGDGSSSSSSKLGILVELGILPPPDLEAEALKERPEEIAAWARPGSGKQWAKRERAAGRVPAVLFSAEDGHLGGRKRLISVDERQMRRLLLKYGRSRFMSRTFDLRVEEDDRRGAGSAAAAAAAAAAATAEAEEEGGGEGSEKSAVTVERVIPKAVHEHLSSDALLNVTFMRLPTQPGARVKVEIPLQFIGEDACPGIRKGGWLFCMRRTVPYECPADTIPHTIEVDLSRLGVGGKVLLADLNVPPSLRLLVRNPNLPVCKIAGSRSLENAAAAGGD